MDMVLWAVLMVLMLVLEALTAGLLTIWFAAGALAALVCAALGAAFGVQVAVFFFISGILLAFLLPYARKKMKTGRTATNADRIIGAEAVVTEEIDQISGTGQIRVNGAVWSAKAAHGVKIAPGERVVVDAISGVKAVVSRKA